MAVTRVHVLRSNCRLVCVQWAPNSVMKSLSRSCSSQFPFYFDTVWFFPQYRTFAVFLPSSPRPFLSYWQPCVHHTSKADNYRTSGFSRDHGSEVKQSALKSPGLLSSLEAGPSFQHSHHAGLLLGPPTPKALGGVTAAAVQSRVPRRHHGLHGEPFCATLIFFKNLITLQSVLKSSKRKKKEGAGLAFLEINLALLVPFTSESLLFDKYANAA